jgi:hypothetical protein
MPSLTRLGTVGEGSGVGDVAVRLCLRQQAGQDAAQVLKEEVGEVVPEAVADDDTQRGEVGAVFREGVRGDQPAALAQGRGNVEDGEVGDAVVHLEGEDGKLAAVSEQGERSHPGDILGEPHGDVTAGLLDTTVALEAEAQEVVVLRDHLGTRAGEVEREGRHVAAEVVDVEDEVLGERLRVSPQRPADARHHQAVLVPGGVDRRNAR